MSTVAWCERAAALLAAGLGHARVIELLGPPPSSPADGGAIRVAWQLAVQLGTPLGAVLGSCAQSARDWERIARDRATALAGPKAAARLMSLLPVLALLLSSALGLGTLEFLFGSVLGWLCVVTGAALLWAGARWTARLLRQAARAESAPGFGCQLSAQLVAAGLAPGRAAAHIDAVWPASSADIDARSKAVVFAEATGMPPARALAAEAAALRAEAAGQAERKAAELAVRLSLPLGVCTLPAFLCWAVIPLMLALLGSTAAAFK